MAYKQLTKIPSVYLPQIWRKGNIFLYIYIFLCSAQMQSLIFSHLEIDNTNEDIDFNGKCKAAFLLLHEQDIWEC